jgi:hypothetical protein
MTRPRSTFSDRDTLDVRGARDMHLVYGPESKRVWVEVRRRHRIILAQRQEAIETLRPVYRLLGLLQTSVGVKNKFVQWVYPELWNATVPWRQLAREGQQDLRDALLKDNVALDEVSRHAS